MTSIFGLKLQFPEHQRRMQADWTTFTFVTLCNYLERYNYPIDKYLWEYRDEDNDWVRIESIEEYETAVSLVKGHGMKTFPLRMKKKRSTPIFIPMTMKECDMQHSESLKLEYSSNPDETASVSACQQAPDQQAEFEQEIQIEREKELFIQIEEEVKRFESDSDSDEPDVQDRIPPTTNVCTQVSQMNSERDGNRSTLNHLALKRPKFSRDKRQTPPCTPSPPVPIIETASISPVEQAHLTENEKPPPATKKINGVDLSSIGMISMKSNPRYFTRPGN